MASQREKEVVARSTHALLVTLLWEAGELSEGQAANLLGGSRLAAREVREWIMAEGREVIQELGEAPFKREAV